MVATLQNRLNLRILLNSITIVLILFLAVRVSYRIKIVLCHVWGIVHTHIHISLYWHHIHWLDSLQLGLVVHVLLLVILNRILFTVLNSLVLAFRYFRSHLQVELLLVWYTHFLFSVILVHEHLVLLIVLVLLNGSTHGVVATSHIALLLARQFS